MLIGALLGLGILARGSELVVVRAAGVSVMRIAVSAWIAGLLIAMLTALLGEVVAPPVQKFARQQKAFSKFSDVSFAGSGSAWVKDGSTIISVHEQSGDNLFGGVYVFRFSGPLVLLSVGHASRAILGETAGHWRLDGYTETRFEDDHTVTTPSRTSSSRPRSILDSSVSPRVSRVSCRRWICGDSSAICAPMAWKRELLFAFWSRIARTSRSSWWRFSPYRLRWGPCVPRARARAS